MTTEPVPVPPSPKVHDHAVAPVEPVPLNVQLVPEQLVVNEAVDPDEPFRNPIYRSRFGVLGLMFVILPGVAFAISAAAT